MGDFSRPPSKMLADSQQQGYLGLYIEQGVPVLDRDLNLLYDLLAARISSTFARHIGDGVPAGADGFAVKALDAPENKQNFAIAAGQDGKPGTCLVAGMEVTIRAATTYTGQTPTPDALSTPAAPQPNPRPDTVYLDVSVTEIDSAVDHELANPDDVGMQTSVRLKLDWTVRVAEGAGMPQPQTGHSFYPLAELRRPHGTDTIDSSMITDLRQQRLTVSDLEQRLSLLEAVLLRPTFAQPPEPQIVPRRGGINSKVMLSGNNFGNGSMTVLFGDGKPAEIVDKPSANKLQVLVPPGLTPAGTDIDVRITVRNQIGSTTSTETFKVLATPAFGRRGTQFTPAQVAPGDRLTINGFNLTAANLKVVFASTPNETPADNVLERTSTKIVVEVPGGTIPDNEVATNLQVILRSGDREVRSDDMLRVERKDAAPIFDDQQFSPLSANVGQQVRLSGRNFNFSPRVSFNYSRGTVAATNLTAVAPNSISVTVPAPPDPVDAQNPATITVETKGGSVTSARQLIVRPG
ncbi:MAG: IPT/TIG domain-containing protein [Candidatus Sericytochromatia bacterium]